MTLIQIVIGSLLGSFLGVVGAEVGKRLFLPAVKKEAERDRLLNECLDLIDEIETGAMSYWSGGLEAGSTEMTVVVARLKAALHTLGKSCAELFNGEPDSMRHCSQEIVQLRKTITGGEFGNENPSVDPSHLSSMQILISAHRSGIRRRRHKLKSHLFW